MVKKNPCAKIAVKIFCGNVFLWFQFQFQHKSEEIDSRTLYLNFVKMLLVKF